jgi:hypothetical protein
VRSVAENLPSQASQYIARPDFNEDTSTRTIHRLYFIGELDRADQMLSQQSGNNFRIVRVRGCGCVREDLSLWHTELHVRKNTSQTIPGRSDDRRVERTGNWKGSGLDPLAPEVFNRLLHAPLRAGDDRLPRGVDVGNPDIFNRL